MQSTTTIQPANPPKSPVVAAVLSVLLLGGAGQIYLGQTKKGILLIVATVLLVCVGVGAFIPFIAAYDAYLVAQRLEAGQPVGDMDFFWQLKAA